MFSFTVGKRRGFFRHNYEEEESDCILVRRLKCYEDMTLKEKTTKGERQNYAADNTNVFVPAEG